MHIWYQLQFREDATFAEAIEKVTELHRFAQTVGFAGARDVPPVSELRIGPETDDHRPTFHVTKKLGGGREQQINVPAIEWVGFMTLPGEGTETAQFGLARYPKTYRPAPSETSIMTTTTRTFDGRVEPDFEPVEEPSLEVLVDAGGWTSWYGFCKTQYAHRFGLDHFMRCHLGLIQLLDHARELGILHHVHDDGGYWESRSADVLVANLRENDRLVAAVVGSLNDQIGGAMSASGYTMVAPITGAPDFEHLGAEGRAILGGKELFAPSIGNELVSSVRARDAEPFAPIIAWPAVDAKNRWPALADNIEAMQRLNPELDVRIVRDQHGISYLHHGRTANGVFKLIMPYRVPDELGTALTQHNQDERRIKLEEGTWARFDATRIERTGTGDLQIRPCTRDVRRANLEVGRAIAAHLGDGFEHKLYPGWCVLPAPDGEEIWEFEWSYWPGGHEVAVKRPDGTYREDRDYWSQLPAGFIGIRDRNDLARETFETRCRTAVEMGVLWCVLADQDAHTLSVFRQDEVETVERLEGWSLRELPGCEWQTTWLGLSKF